MARRTRHGLYGGPRALYGSFSGKVNATPDPADIIEPADIFQADRQTAYVLANRRTVTMRANRGTTYIRAERY